jgi:hypothetical protein
MWKRNPATPDRRQDPGLAPTVPSPCRRYGSASGNRRASSSRRRWRAIGALGLFVLAAQLGAQSLQILPSPASGGGGTFRIMIVSPPESPVLALQWRVAVAKGAEIAADGIQTGTAATAAGKGVTCRAVEGRSSDDSGYVCILAGGRQPIPDGPVAVVRLLARGRGLSVAVHLTGIKAVTIATRAKIIPDIEADVPVGARQEGK